MSDTSADQSGLASCAGHRDSTDGRGLTPLDSEHRIVEHLHPITGKRCPGSGGMLGDEVWDPAEDRS